MNRVQLEHIKQLLYEGNKMSISTCTFEALIDELENQLKIHKEYEKLISDIIPLLVVISKGRTSLFGKEVPTQDAKLCNIILDSIKERLDGIRSTEEFNGELQSTVKEL